MRLYTSKKSLVQFLIIAFLTLLFEPCANAQSLLASNYKLNNCRHNPVLINEEENKNDHSETEPNEKATSAHVDLWLIYRSANSVSCRIIENNFKVYPRFCPRFSRVYATCFKNNVRLAFKPFKVVIILF